MLSIAIRLRELRTEQSVRILVNLLGCLKIFFVTPIVFEFTFCGGVVAANLRSRFVDTASMIGLKMLAGGVDQKVPVFTLNKNRCPVVQQIPADEVKISPIDRFIDCESEVMAALSCAIFAKICISRKITPSAFRHLLNHRHSNRSP